MIYSPKENPTDEKLLSIINDSVDLFLKTLPKVSVVTKHIVYKKYLLPHINIAVCKTFGRVFFNKVINICWVVSIRWKLFFNLTTFYTKSRS
ncbi:MAG: hypothetical protein K8R68_11255, partial [Bacteroidales bacterium]|nr:hypothetical protein [Bacteroidales bacterium]